MDNNSNQRKTIAVLFGGRSVEHEISVITGLQVIKAMDTVKYKPVPVYIAPSGKWYSGHALLDRQFYKNMPASLLHVQEVTRLPDPSIHGLTIVRDTPTFGLRLFKQKRTKEIPIDVYFLAFHGSYGEDGCLQGLLEMSDAAYAGSDVVASAISMNKHHSKMIVAAHGVPVLPSIVLDKHTDLEKLRRQIFSSEGIAQFPLFVKPASLGSSIGISKATDAAELDAALLKAFQYDAAAIVEPCLTNKVEINISIMENLQGGEPIASMVEIPVPAAGAELTYEDKYMRGGGKKNGPEPEGMAGLVRVIDPNDLDVETKKQVREFGVRAFKALGCAGIVRIDFMMDLDSDTIYFNEINPLPGSFAFYLWEKSHPPALFTDLVTTMIESAQKRHQLRRSLSKEIGFQALFK